MVEVQRLRRRRLSELSSHIEAIGPEALGLRGACGPTTLAQTLPHVHLMLMFSQGSHRTLHRLPHSFMGLTKDLSTFDGELFRRGTGGEGSQPHSQHGSGAADLANWNAAAINN